MDIDLTGLHLLVIDDNEDDRELARIILTQQGAETEAVSSVAEGLAAFGRKVPDVVVCDLLFGKGEPGGYTFIRSLARAPEDPGERVPVAVITGFDLESHARLLAAGFDDVCVKPCEPEALVRLVARLAGRTVSAA